MTSCDASFVITGQECNVVILTTVRSLPEEDIPDHPSHTWVNENLGFLTDEHLMNVAITRAREALCIIGKYQESSTQYIAIHGYNASYWLHNDTIMYATTIANKQDLATFICLMQEIKVCSRSISCGRTC